MKHFGDIKELSGYELPIVDIITGGSPCQDLSVAGNREGLSGERSGLFMEQVRIVKEMRKRDREENGRAGFLIRPRYMVWENVEGAYSSNGGRDFQSVLTEIARIAEEGCPEVPMPEKGKWSKSGCIYDGMGRWSIAWRLHDAQFWNVPQRRKRIALVADFGGLSAPEILFEREGLHWYPSEGEKAREAAAGDTGESTDKAVGAYTLKVRGGVERDCYGKRAGKGALIQTELSGTLGASQDQTLFQSSTGINGEIAGTLDASYYKGCGERAGIEREVVLEKSKSCLNPWDVQSKHVASENGIAESLYSGECRYGGGESYVMQTVAIEGNGTRESHHGNGYRESNVMYTLNSVEQHGVAYSVENHPGDGRCKIIENGTVQTLQERMGTGGNNVPLVMEIPEESSKIYDARGNGEGAVSPTITGDHQNRITDYTAIVVDKDGESKG